MLFPLLPPGPSPHGFRYHFARSTYVTVITDWFLGFVGKAAHLILILTTLYTGAELLPGVTLPAAVNNGVFVAQMLVLDVGGMGLAKLAMQARDQGNSEGARHAEYLSTWLIRIVIASLVTVAVEQAVHTIPGLTALSTTVAGVTIVIGGVLTIARAICAVHYGRVMHLLQTDDEQTPVPVVEVEELVRQAMDDLAVTLRAEQQQAFAQMRQEVESHLPARGEEARASLPLSGATLYDQVQAIGDASQSQMRPPVLSEPLRQPEARASEPQSEPVVPAPRPEPGMGARGTSDERLQTAYDRLVAQGQRTSGRALAREAHINRATASIWLAACESHQLEPAPGIEAETRSGTPRDQ